MPDPFSLDLAPGVHGIRDGFANWYLVADDDGLTAIDAGLPASWGLLERLVGRIGRRLEDLRAIVLTHAHFDHVGFAEKARAQLGVPVYCHTDEVPVTRHPLRYKVERLPVFYMWRPQTLAIIGRLTASGALWAPAIKEVSTFSDGDTLDVPGRPKVVFTPGHTLGHVALHLPDRDVVFAGDAFVMLDPYTGLRGPRLVSRAATASTQLATNSLDRLAETGAGLALTGHGEPWRDGIEAAVQRTRQAERT